MRARGRRAHPRERGAVPIVRAMREIQTDDIGAGGDERIEDRVVVARRADRRNDLGMSHRRNESFIDRIAKWALSYLNRMTVDSWLQAAIADAARRGLPELKPLLEALARATTLLRDADWNEDATGRRTPHG